MSESNIFINFLKKNSKEWNVKKKINVLVIILVLLFSASLVYAGGQSESGGKADRATIVLLMLGMESPYCPPYVSNFTEIVSNAGMNFFMFNGEFDAQLQAQQMDDAIAMQPELIVVFAADSQGIAPSVKKAYDAGIPVFMCNNPPVKESEQYTVAYAGPNNYLEGQVAGEMIYEVLGGEGDIVMIEGLAGQDAQINRAQGMLDKLDEMNADINLLARQTADWRKDLAVQVMQDFVTRYGDEIDLVYGQDDTLAIGAAIALEEAGMGGKIPIIGIGGSKEGLKAIDEGLVFGTVLQSPIDETDLVANMAVEMVKQGFGPEDKWDPYWNFMETPPVTQENVEEYLPGDW